MLYCTKPLRRRSNRRRTHREDGALAESPLAANRQMDRRGRAESGRGDEPASIARRRASVTGLRVCRHSVEVGEFYLVKQGGTADVFSRICPCMGTGAFFYSAHPTRQARVLGFARRLQAIAVARRALPDLPCICPGQRTPTEQESSSWLNAAKPVSRTYAERIGRKDGIP